MVVNKTIHTTEVFEEEIYDGSIDTSGIIVNDKAYSNTRQLDFYLQNGITTSGHNSMIDKNYSNSQSNWWLRTSYYRSSSAFYFVRYDGTVASYYANNESGVAPAFRIG